MTEWEVDCTDASGRTAKLKVRVERGVLSVIAPPGESAKFSPYHAKELHRVWGAALNLTVPTVVQV